MICGGERSNSRTTASNGRGCAVKSSSSGPRPRRPGTRRGGGGCHCATNGTCLRIVANFNLRASLGPMAAVNGDNGIEVEGLVREFKGGPGRRRHRPRGARPARSTASSGPNGAGKSTTVHMLTTLLPPTAGTRDRGRPRRRHAGARGAQRDRRRAAGGGARPVPHRARALELQGGAARPAAGRARRARATSCSSASGSPRRPTARSAATRAA